MCAQSSSPTSASLRLEQRVDDLAQVLEIASRPPMSQSSSSVDPVAVEAHPPERVDEAVHVPLVDGRAPARCWSTQRVELLVEERPDGLGQVLVAEDLVALGVDRLALLVDDVVELDDALADVEVEALDAASGRSRSSCDTMPRLDRDVVLEAHPLHEPGDPLRGEALHQVVFEREVEARRARVALAAGAAAELVVDAPARRGARCR